jgi:phosphatidylserine/phosphatidylglycerophosphate/cardiolipin synthase-like enzyme
MRHIRDNRGAFARVAIWSLLGALTGCSDDPEAAVENNTAVPQTLRIVEVLARPNPSQPAFVELRNDGEQATDVSGVSLKIGSTKNALTPFAVDSVESAEGRANMVPPHGLALIVDSATPAEVVVAAACEAPIVATKQGLGSAHAAADDILVSTLALQQRRHCVPVFAIADLVKKLAAARTLALSNSSGTIDKAQANWDSAPIGVSFERRGIGPTKFEKSPIGATPAARNFFRSDFHFLGDAEARPPLFAMSASPWRVGDEILALKREAAAAEADGKSARAEEFRAEAQALEDGKLPENPLVEPFIDLASEADESVVGSFFQINDGLIIDGYIAAKGRGVDIRLTTDAAYKNDPLYTAGYAALARAGIPLIFDELNGLNRSALSHNKFMVVDQRWLWTGSFNPIHDEPIRVHADNAVVIDSRAMAALHHQEFETMFAGTFGADKRAKGVGGGSFAVDGAPISVRYSPGMTATVLKRRANVLNTTGDVRRACDAKLTSGASALPARYRTLDPCGGPYDLIMGEVARAQSSVYFVSFSISLADLGHLMIERHNSGVDVRGVVDTKVYNAGVAQTLSTAGADIRYTPSGDPICADYVTPRYNCPTNPNKVFLHHKFILIDYGTDHPVVITGSHNMSDRAEEGNDETLVVIRDRAIAEQYFRIFSEAYSHPQTSGHQRSTEGLPGLAITEVLPTADPSQPQFVEIANFGLETASLSGLELWNRRGGTIALGSSASLAPGRRAVVAIGPSASLAIPSGTPVVNAPADPQRPFVDPRTALVLRDARDGRWVATYDPYTAQLNLPEGVRYPTAGKSMAWKGFDGNTVEELMVELLGVDTTPEADVPTWAPRGLYSDWVDDHHVTPTSLVLFHGPLGTWAPPTKPTPGK